MPKQVYFAGHKTVHKVGQKITAFEADPGVLKLPGLAVAALGG
jgi:hypothetical protein